MMLPCSQKEVIRGTGQSVTERSTDVLLVVSAHAADFVWRAAGAIALTVEHGRTAHVVCLTYGERGESASAWRQGKSIGEIKALRRSEAEQAATTLGATIEFLDAGDYPLRVTDSLLTRLVEVYRTIRPTTVLTHTLLDPYNKDHVRAAEATMEARILAQAAGFPASGEPIGAPALFLFEPHQPEQCGFRVDVLLDITRVFDKKLKAMECMAAQTHLYDYYNDLARRRGVQLRRNAGPNLGFTTTDTAEAFSRVYPQVADQLA